MVVVATAREIGRVDTVGEKIKPRRAWGAKADGKVDENPISSLFTLRHGLNIGRCVTRNRRRRKRK